jgi:putative endonuclease
MAKHNNLGKDGETAAVNYLKAAGHAILAQNYRAGRNEVDIISKHNHLLIFTEVKTRSNSAFGTPAESVTPAKQKRTIEAAEAYINETAYEGEIRFDVLSIYHNNGNWNIRHIQGAYFGMGK